MEKEIYKIFENRIIKRLEELNFDFKKIGLSTFYLAGNSLNKKNPSDYDLFPVYEKDFINISNKKLNIIFESKSAVIVKHNDKIIQFCNYYHSNLNKLICNFDFAHIQIGAKIIINEFNSCEIENIETTRDYNIAKMSENTYFVNSDYPLSSLLRIIKYIKEDSFSGKSYIISILNILKNIINRGFKNYDDFKDQLDAIDLGLIPGDFKDLESKNLKDLYELLRKDI